MFGTTTKDYFSAPIYILEKNSKKRFKLLQNTILLVRKGSFACAYRLSAVKSRQTSCRVWKVPPPGKYAVHLDNQAAYMRGNASETIPHRIKNDIL